MQWVSTIAVQQEGLGFLRGICMFSICMSVFTLNSLVSSYSLETCMSGSLVTLGNLGHSEDLHSGLQTENLISPTVAQGKVPRPVAEGSLYGSSLKLCLDTLELRRSLKQSSVIITRILSVFINMQALQWDGAHSPNAHLNRV